MTIPKFKQAPPAPIFTDHKLLTLCFSSAHLLGEKSNFDGFLQRMLAQGMNRVQCRRCHGTTWRNQREIDRWHQERKAFETLNPTMSYTHIFKEPLPHGECKRCEGQGSHQGKTLEVDLTARPSGKITSTPKEPPSAAALSQVAKATRAMLRVERSEPKHARALSAYHGDIGEIACVKYGNRLLAVILLLSPGRKLITTKGTALKLLEKLHHLSTCSDEKRAKFDGVEADAQFLIEQAAETWSRCLAA